MRWSAHTDIRDTRSERKTDFEKTWRSRIDAARRQRMLDGNGQGRCKRAERTVFPMQIPGAVAVAVMTRVRRRLYLFINMKAGVAEREWPAVADGGGHVPDRRKRLYAECDKQRNQQDTSGGS